MQLGCFLLNKRGKRMLTQTHYWQGWITKNNAVLYQLSLSLGIPEPWGYNTSYILSTEAYLLSERVLSRIWIDP